MKIETRLNIGDIIYQVEDKYNSIEPVECTGCAGVGSLEIELMDGRLMSAKCPACDGLGKEPNQKVVYIVCKYMITARLTSEERGYETIVEYRMIDSDNYMNYFKAMSDVLPDTVFTNREEAENKMKELNK